MFRIEQQRTKVQRRGYYLQRRQHQVGHDFFAFGAHPVHIILDAVNTFRRYTDQSAGIAAILPEDHHTFTLYQIQNIGRAMSSIQEP